MLVEHSGEAHVVGGGVAHRLGVSYVRDLDQKARVQCQQGEAAVMCTFWNYRKTTPEQLFRVEGFCDLRGVPLRSGDKIYLPAMHCTR